MTQFSDSLFNAVVVAHASEIGIKSKRTRQSILKILYSNISKKIDTQQKLRNIANRSILITDNAVNDALTIAKTTFGVSYTAPIYFFEWETYPKLLNILVDFCKKILQESQKFALDAKSVGKNRLSTTDIKRDLGSKLLEVYNNQITVDLDNPDIKFMIEVRHEFAWIYYMHNQGLDGFPQGSQQKYVISLLRPWKNDYLASFLIMRRGVGVQPVKFSTDSGSIIKVDPLFNYFSSNFFYKKPIEIDIYPVLQELNLEFKENICTACTYLTEKIASYLITNMELSGFSSGVRISEPQSDINFDTLSWLENKKESISFRPLLFGSNMGEEFIEIKLEDQLSCCNLVRKKSITHTLTQSEMARVEVELKKIISNQLENGQEVNKSKTLR